MTEITFYLSAAEREATACRLLRKAVRQGSGVTVCGEADRLGRLSAALWSFEATDFIPNVLVRAGDADSPLQRRTPVWLVEDAELPTPHAVLLSLGDVPCDGFATYQRLIEVVSADPEERAAARVRWKHYQSRGYNVVHHELST